LWSLESVKTEYPEKADLIEILPGDANEHLAEFADKLNRKNARAVVFIDPFGLSLSWETIALLGKTERVDLWYLVPSAGMSRQV
jgi:three-Cys-motif partner protein